MTQPDEAVIDTLVTAGVCTAKGTDCFWGPMRESDSLIPNQAVFALLSGETAPMDIFNTSTSIRHRRVQVTVRSNVREFSTGQTLALDTRDALHLASISGTISVKVVNGPTLITQDDLKRFIWTINVVVTEQS